MQYARMAEIEIDTPGGVQVRIYAPTCDIKLLLHLLQPHYAQAATRHMSPDFNDPRSYGIKTSSRTWFSVSNILVTKFQIVICDV